METEAVDEGDVLKKIHVKVPQRDLPLIATMMGLAGAKNREIFAGQILSDAVTADAEMKKMKTAVGNLVEGKNKSKSQ